MNPRRSNTSLPQPGRSAYGIATAVVLVLIPVVVVLGGNWLQEFLNFGAGVLALVSLTCSVIWGLVAQDRLILNTRQRIVAQGIHRVTAVSSIAFLLVHITIKLAMEHTVLIGALIPFSLGFTGIGGLIGLGSLAALLMIFVGVTGALRNQFASPAATAARWRMMHMMAYPALCAALIHGLFAGRAAKPFFMVSYQLCLVAVIAALALRSAPRSFKRKVADRLAAVIGSEGGMRDELAESRARVSENGPAERAPRAERERERPAPGPRTSSLFGTPAPEAGGFAAAYRTAAPTPTPAYGADQTARMNMPFDTQATEAMPRVDAPGSTSGSWPIPSPPPVGEAPPSAYDPMQDTGFNIPVYGAGAPQGEPNPGARPYNPNDPYNGGPTPGAGEAWNTPSGGYR